MRVNVSLFGRLVKMRYLKNTRTNTEGPSIANTELSSHVGGGNHTRGWLHAPQTEHKHLCCHDESDSTRRRWCKGNLQPNTWEEVLPVEMSQLLTQNKTNTKIPRKLNRTKHGITPTYLLLLSNFQKSRPQNLWCTKWTACMVNRNKCSKKRCLCLFYYCICASSGFVKLIWFSDLTKLEIHTWCAMAHCWHYCVLILPLTVCLRSRKRSQIWGPGRGHLVYLILSKWPLSVRDEMLIVAV